MGCRVEITGYEDLIKALDRVDEALSGKVKREMVKAAADVVARRARQLCPRSATTGSRRHWSRKTATARGGVKPLAETIGVEVRDYGPRALAVVGPEYPAGALAHLVEFAGVDAYDRVMWGRQTNRPAKPQPFMRPAFDETQAEQLAAMEAVVAGAIRDLGI